MADRFLTAFELETHIKDFPPESQFLARELFKVQQVCPTCQNRLSVLEARDKTFLGVIGGASGLLGGAIVAILKFFEKQ